MEVIDEKNIILKRELSELDLFVLKFVRLLEKHMNYVVISGYVALIFGRSRGTEDVDIIIPKISQEEFHVLYQDLLKNNFWPINADDEKELYSMLNEKLAIRFAERGKVIPNIEIKFAKDFIDALTLQDKLKVTTSAGEMFISNIAFQIAYKRFILSSPKDLEDALYLEQLFGITKEKIEMYKHIMKEHGRI